jgi:hypothetical protein
LLSTSSPAVTSGCSTATFQTSFSLICLIPQWFPHSNLKFLYSTHSGVTCHPKPDAVGSASLLLLPSRRSKPEQQGSDSSRRSVPTNRPRPAKPHRCEDQTSKGEEKTPAVDSQQRRVVVPEASDHPSVDHRPDCQHRRRRSQREARQRRPGALDLPPMRPAHPPRHEDGWKGHVHPEDEQDWKNVAHRLWITAGHRSRRPSGPGPSTEPRSRALGQSGRAAEHRSERPYPVRSRRPRQGSPCRDAKRFSGRLLL